MTNTSIDISGKIDADTAGVLAHIKAATDSLGIPFFVIGAMARDIFLKHLYGLPPHRLTLDMDFGVSISTWGDFSNLKTELIDHYGFGSTNQLQRLRAGNIQIDIVPFGPIAGLNLRIHWPPDESLQMSTAGFEEAFEASLQVRISASPELRVRVCSLPGLVILKLISWHERYPERQRDAEDILEIMDKYENAMPVDRLYSEEKELIAEEGFDNQKAAIRLLGRDMAKIASPGTGRLILSILDEETKEDSKPRLAIDMARAMSTSEGDLAQVSAAIYKLKQGFVEAKFGETTLVP